MFNNKAQDGMKNVCGENIRKLRKAMPEKVSQRRFADMLCLYGLDVHKNVVSGIESRERFVTDIELKAIKEVLNVSYEELLN